MLLGLDIASRLTGWCAGLPSELPTVGVYEFPAVGDDLGRLGALFQTYIETTFDRFGPTTVIYEAPILVVKSRGAQRTDKPLVLRKLYGLGFLLETFCQRQGVSCYEVGLHDVKRALTGNAMAPKEDMVAQARKVGLRLPSGPGVEDAADAFGVWICGVRQFDKASAARWDSVLYGRAGALL